MITGEGFDSSIEDIMKADVIRAASITGERKSFYLIGYPWTIREEPWRCQWFDPRIKEVCAVHPVGSPYEGDKYVMFITSDDRGSVKNYVFLKDQYHAVEE